MWLLQLSAGEELGLSRVLAGARHDELRQQWRDYRAEMTGTGREPSKLESVGPSAIEHQADGRATVTEQVRAVWWDDAQILAGTAHPWRWELREDRGGGGSGPSTCRHGAGCTSGRTCVRHDR